MRTYLVTFRDGSTLITHATFLKELFDRAERAFFQDHGWWCQAVGAEVLS